MTSSRGGQQDTPKSAASETVVTPFGGIVRACRMLNCPVDRYGLCHHCGFRGDPECVIEVCRYCYSENLRGAEHGVSVSDGTEDGGMLVCLWPCRHEVMQHEPRCLVCEPYTDAEMPF